MAGFRVLVSAARGTRISAFSRPNLAARRITRYSTSSEPPSSKGLHVSYTPHPKSIPHAPLRSLSLLQFLTPIQGSFYKSFGPPVLKVFLGAVFTYQLLYWTWLKLESLEIKKEKNEEIANLEEEVKRLKAARGSSGKAREGKKE
jgi:hypothetical protein